MKKKIAGVMIVCIMLLCFPMKASAEPGNLYAQSAVLIDADSGRVLFGKDCEKQLPMASTTKIMTCILILENTGPGEEAQVSAEAASQPKVHLGVRQGETYYVEDLLYSLMLESHNDAAVVLAEHVGGSVSGFARMMNEKARELGCEHTHFVTPNGLDSQDEGGVHSTTAKDLALIMRYCITQSPKREEFLKITQTISYAFSNVEKNRSFSCVNHNAFLGMMDGALTGKTGFTANAGYCYVGALQRDGKTFIVALLACGWPNNKSYKWSDTKKLMEYGLENYVYQNVWEDVALRKIPVADGIPESGSLEDLAYTETKIQEPEEISVLLKKDEKVTVQVSQEESLRAPVEEGQVVGSVKYFLGEQLIREYPVTACSRVDEISFSWCARKVMERFLGEN